MRERLLNTDAVIVLRDFTAELQKMRELAYDDDTISELRGQPGRFQARNAALLSLARYIGELRMYRGALWSLKNGNSTSGHYISEGHLESLIETRVARGLAMARLACAACPLAGVCGIGPDELVIAIKQKPERRRFVARLRRPDNTHLCETNVETGRLKANTV